MFTLGAFVLLGHLPQKYVAIVAELQPLFKSIVLLILALSPLCFVFSGRFSQISVSGSILLSVPFYLFNSLATLEDFGNLASDRPFN